MRIDLHLGAHKTSTTYLQRCDELPGPLSSLAGLIGTAALTELFFFKEF